MATSASGSAPTSGRQDGAKVGTTPSAATSRYHSGINGIAARVVDGV